MIAKAENIQKANKQQIKSNKVGKFILDYQVSSSESYKEQIPTNKGVVAISSPLSNAEIREFLMESKIFDSIVDNLNNSGLIIRQNIPVVFAECKQANAFWSPSERKIVICYENMALDLILFTYFTKDSSEKVLEKSLYETIFAFYHELGHGLINVLPLNAVGQEEDTVDEFASVMMYRKYDSDTAGEIILASSEYYELLYKIYGNSPAWGEHAPYGKRLFNLACFVFGSNPNKYGEVFLQKLITVHERDTIGTFREGDKIGEDSIKIRAARCINDFEQKIVQWNKLLLPHYATVNNNSSSVQTPPNNPSGTSRRNTYW